MSYRGDIAIGSTIDWKFTSIDAGIPTSVSGAFVAAYPDNSTTEVTAGITFTGDFDSRVGLNNIRVAATLGNGYAAGSNYDVVMISGTVGGKSLVGYILGSFSIQNRYSASGDPWGTALPGSYTPGQAGYILASRMPTGTVLVGDKTGFSLSSPQNFDLNGNISGTITNVQNVLNPVGLVTGTYVSNLANLDVAVSTRASQSSLDTLDDVVDTEVGAIKAKTDNLPADPADASDIAASFATVNTKLDDIDNFVDTEVSAIKTKTDQLTFTKANELDANVQSLNGTEIIGDGNGTPWGPV